jgi:DNA-binding transcriptional ArsR family regulator
MAQTTDNIAEFLQLASAKFQALADPGRLYLLLTLKSQGELRVGELAEATKLAQPTVSKGLSILRQAGFVNSRRDGASILYSLNGDTVATLCDTICRSLEQDHGQLTQAIRAMTNVRKPPRSNAG